MTNGIKKNPLNAYRPHPRVQITMPDDEKILTKQSFEEESNINIIMARYVKTGMLDHLNQYGGDYGNFIGFQDYHTSMNLILDAGQAFMALPAQTRAKFGNDPQTFLAFVQDPDNLEEMREMGLAHKASKTADQAENNVQPPPAPAVDETPPAPGS